MTPDTVAAERVIADRGHTLDDKSLAVAILRAVHPYATTAELAAMCGISRDTYAGIWYRLTRRLRVKGHRRRSSLTTAAGEANRNARLTAEQVTQIRHRFTDHGESPDRLAAEYAVSANTVNAILRGDTWRHAGGPTSRQDRRGRHGNHARGIRHPRANREEAA